MSIIGNEIKTHPKRVNQCPCCRTGQRAVLYNDCVYIFGGWHTQLDFCRDNWILNLENMKWKKILNHSLPKTCGHSASLISKSGTVFIFGGFNKLSAINDMYRYSIEKNHCELLEDMPTLPPPRYDHASCVVNDRFIYIFYGYTQNDVWRFDVESFEWELIECFYYLNYNNEINNSKYMETIHSRFLHTATMVNNDIWVFGGESVPSREMLLRFHIDLNSSKMNCDVYNISNLPLNVATTAYTINTVNNRLLIVGHRYCCLDDMEPSPVFKFNKETQQLEFIPFLESESSIPMLSFSEPSVVRRDGTVLYLGHNVESEDFRVFELRTHQSVLYSCFEEDVASMFEDAS